VEFSGLEEGDTRIVADTLCEVPVEEDLLKHLHMEAQGKISRIVIGLGQIEKKARVNKLESIGLREWGGPRQAFNFYRPDFEAKR